MCTRSVKDLQKCLLIPVRFSNFFNHVDNFPDAAFLFVTSGGIEVTRVADDGQRKSTVKDALVAVEASDSEEDEVGLDTTEDSEG